MPEATEVDVSTKPDVPTLADQYEFPDTSPEPIPEKSSAVPQQQPKEPPSLGASPSGSVSGKPSKYLTQMAHDLGVPDDQIKGCDNSTLELLVFHLNRQASAVRRESVPAATDRSLGQNKPFIPSETEPIVPEEADTLGINESEYDPGLVKTLKDLKKANKELLARLDAIEPNVKTLHERETHRSNLSLAQRMDKLFTADSHIFGEGTRADLADDSVELQRRHVLLGVMQNLEGSPEERYGRAKEILYGVTSESPVPKKPAPPKNPVNGQFVKPLSEAQEKWLNGSLPKPTQRVTGEPAGVKKAEKTAARIMQENGSLDDDDIDVNSFPG